MASETKSDPPPYSQFANEVQQITTSPNSTHNSDGARFANGVSRSRSMHLCEIIRSKILPLVEHRASLGLSHTEIALIPATKEPHSPTSRFDNSSSDFPEQHEDPTLRIDQYDLDVQDDVIHQKLSSSMDTPRFWTQSIVLSELQRLTYQALTDSIDHPRNHLDDKAHHDVESKRHSTGSHQANSELATAPSPIAQENPTLRQGRLARLANFVKSPFTTTTKSTPQPQKSHVHVKVQQQELCVRTTNAFGLYESRTQEAVIVRIDLEHS